MRTLIILFCLVAYPVHAGCSRTGPSCENWGSSSAWIELHEPDEDHHGARAQLTFHNEMVHGPSDNECFDLTLDEFTVTVCFEWNVGGGQAERATVLPPDGYVAQPPEITVNEGQSETLYIYGATS